MSLTVRINDKVYSANPGETIIDVLKRNNIYVPHVCLNEGLVPIESCDTCLVRVNGKLMRACSTRVEDGMTITTNDDKSKGARKEAISRILRYHKLYCTVCENNNGDCVLHEAVIKEKVFHQRYVEKPYSLDNSGPFYVYDPAQCILCGRCVEACQDFAVNEVIWIDWNLNPPRVVWDQGNPIGNSSCVNCGTCVTVCPVNALMEKGMLGEAGLFTWINPELKKKTIEAVGKVEDNFSLLMTVSELESKARQSQIKKTKTVCTYCGVGCSFEVWTKGRKILKVEPKPESPANGILTCVKGKFGWDFVNSPDRITKPLIREGDHFREASWDEAIQLVARKFKEIKERYGPDSLGFIASDKMTNEEAYLLQKLARAVVGTNNVDNSSRYCQSPATVGLWRTVGIGGDSGTIRDIENADLILIVGHNTTESHPVVGSKVKRAQKIRGAKIAVIDVRKHEMAERANLFIRPKPGTDAAVLAGVAKYIVDQDWVDHEFLKRVNGFEEFKETIKGFTLDYVESVSGVPREQIIKLAEMIHQAKGVAVLWGMGVTQHLGGADTSTIISDLLLLTGNYGRPGTGAFPMRGHNNVQGVSDFGCLPNYMVGYQKMEESVMSKFEDSWRTTLNRKPGLQIPQMIEGVLEGKIHALYVVGEDTVMVDCGTPLTRKALENVDFLVVQDMFMTETAKLADVILPAAASLEKDGTFVNTERRIQRIYKAMDPLGESKPDWEIIQMIANAMGANWNYHHPSEIMDEIARLTPIFAGVSYSRLEGFNSLVWPVNEDGTDTPLLYVNSFATPDGKAILYPLEWKPRPLKDEVHSIVVNTGRVLEHFHGGTMTGRVEGLRRKFPETFVEISKELAERYSIKNGDLVLVKSKFGGEIKARALVSERVSGEEVFIPLFASEPSKGVNNLTGQEFDKASGTPGYKDTPVLIEKISSGEGTPLPRDNWRFHVQERKRQIGIEVTKKWMREEFKPLTE
ncbi:MULTISPECIES: formate dehydrogenase subunit alpha [Metallosphaera]|uniref:Formate dehydrogenase, alpha subunit n=3 Tax=Metallosphaera TaxID=41980 RepID=A4YGC4_METS5|nr:MULTISPECIES: formate dehydrogenase subunit alpha [Metallosphaera]ABP95476.1 formate dehydrogenase, alpha subunit [Metallosphaera sedula DSM 5348]AIM27461.1 formate dehydrogenase, alpha subunit [Metallosphaera sedula]AKV74332.1 oxidoreductase [Metallosphaera sedula]AKV76571.1 oxidoreductase [Metallosphaera sedula]AKV78823.1 oxidoreductase [Metallosphaera sedula]